MCQTEIMNCLIDHDWKSINEIAEESGLGKSGIYQSSKGLRKMNIIEIKMIPKIIGNRKRDVIHFRRKK